MVRMKNFDRKGAAEYLGISERELVGEVGNLLFYPIVRLNRYKTLRDTGKVREMKKLRNRKF